jgi:hypothetical protein
MNARVQSMMTLLSFLPHRFSGLAHQNDPASLRNDASIKQKSRRSRTPAVFNCVGSFANGSSGRRPDYPLSNYPMTSILCANG